MDQKGAPHISLQTTDRDILLRAATIMGVKRETNYKPRGKATYKQVYGFTVHGIRAVGWMMTIYPLMGERRQEKIREILSRWKASKRMPRGARGERLMSICHPDRPRCSDLLCRKCWYKIYMRKWRAARKAALQEVPS